MSINTYLKWLFLLVLAFGEGAMAFAQMQTLDQATEAKLLINKAELALIVDDLSLAKQYYEKVLAQNSQLLTKDINNILVVAAELQDSELFYATLDQLLEKKISSKTIVDKLGEHKITQDKRWEQFLMKNDMLSANKSALRITLDSMLVADQEFRKKPGSYRLYGDTIRKIDSTNMNLLFSWIEDGVFPSEFDIGAKNLYGLVGWEVVLLHYTQSTSVIEDKTKITPLLLDLARQGKIMPNQLGYLIDSQDGDVSLGVINVFSLDGVGDRNTIYVPKYTALERASVEAARRIIGCEPLEDYLRKVRFRRLHRDSKFVFDTHLTILEAGDSMYKTFETEWDKITE